MIGIHLFDQFDDLIGENARTKVEEQWNEEAKHPGAMDYLQKQVLHSCIFSISNTIKKFNCFFFLQFKCCGNDSSNDYINILHRPETPSSCYVISNTTVGCFTGVENAIIKSYAYTLRPNWGTVILSVSLFIVVHVYKNIYILFLLQCVLVAYTIFLVIHFRNKKNKKRRENFQI